MSDFGKISVIIPAYYANKQLEKMTKRCIDSIGSVDEIILQVDKNGDGYSHTTNKGLKRAQGDILIVGNNDLTFPVMWLTELLKPLEMGYDVATCWTSDQEVQLEDRIELNAKFGSIFAMKRKVYEAIGPFDEQFRGYFSDLDYRQRMLDEGFTIGKNLNFVIPHLAKATYKVTDDSDEEYYRAKSLFEIKWGFME